MSTTFANAGSASASALDVLWSPETALSPLNAASEPWVRSLVWGDFKVAVAFFVVAPLALLAWAVVARIPTSGHEDKDKSDGRGGTDASPPIAETVLRYMTSYWQASSLLLLTVALDIQEQNACVVAGLLAQAMIVTSLWWWEDLNEELAAPAGASDDAHDALGRAFVFWRYVATVAASAGVALQVPFQGCVAAPSLAEASWCAPWLEPPAFAAGLVGVAASPALGRLAAAGCVLYAVVLAYYGAVLLPAAGRRGRAPRPPLMDAVTPVGLWQRMGFLEGPQE